MVTDPIITTFATTTFTKMLGNLAASYITKPDRKIGSSEAEIQTDFRDHLKNTFEKCTKIKTILNTNVPAETLSIYVDQRFRFEDEEIDQYDFVSKIKKGGAYIISGTGGGGKSMFMRYLWLSLFEDPAGRIPFFLELRNLNRFTHQVFEDFIYHSIIRSGSNISQKNFHQALKNGDFVLFLDGFDEINFERRTHFEEMIIDLQEQNPEITIVVTSRPDERFSGWTQFSVVDVLPLSLGQTKNLIKRAPYDEDQKKFFLSRLDKIYKQYTDFLSNPLLAYMMLVTFAFNPDIPNKMFPFYEQAFEALYHRHDLTKGYRRKFHCEIEKQKFIRLLSFFCLKSYYDQNYEFTIFDLSEIIDDVKKIEKIEVNTNDFIKDLIESVCIIKLEGLTYTFTHRSFQEYFAAYCISRVAIRNVDHIFSEFSNRYSDSVLKMVYDINADVLREKYIIPNARKYSKFIDRKSDRGIYESFAERCGAVFTVRVFEEKYRKGRPSSIPLDELEDSISISLSLSGEMQSFYENICRIRSGSDSAIENQPGDRQLDDVRFAKFLVQKFQKLIPFECNISTENNLKKVTIFHYSMRGRQKFDKEKFLEFDQKEILREFHKTRMHRYLIEESKRFISSVREERDAYHNVSSAFSDLF